MSTNTLLTKKHCLIIIKEQLPNLSTFYNKELENIKTKFCGNVFYDIETFSDHDPDANIYLCGNIETNYSKIKNVHCKCIYVIKELSHNYDEHYNLLNIGQVPINIHNMGIYHREFFNSNINCFDLIQNAHQFQTLRESNKPGDAYRSGLYITKVKEIENDVYFKLLRCSSNFDGPTDNLRDIDNEILIKVNDFASDYFNNPAELNHVLAQIYHNKMDEKNVGRKAKIKAHSDKTKDMPENGLIAFCTFYKFNDIKNVKKSTKDLFDYCYGQNNKETTILTKIRFKLKDMVTDPTLKKQFDITLYPNSIFIISLFTNRLYTHEIIPSGLPIDKLPTRMGYVIRCSNTEAIFKNGQTYINENNNHIKLEEPNENLVKELKDLYFKENVTDEYIKYNNIYFSLNKGDYEKPIL